MIRLLVLALVSTLFAAAMGASPAAAAGDPELQQPSLGITSADEPVSSPQADASEPPTFAPQASVSQISPLFKKLRVQIMKRHANGKSSTLGRKSSLGNRQLYSGSCRYFLSYFVACYHSYSTGVFTGYGLWPADSYTHWERLYRSGSPIGWLASVWKREWGRGWEPLQCKYYQYYDNNTGSFTLYSGSTC